MAKRKTTLVEKVDGLSPKDRQKIRNAVRQIWQRSYPRKLCVARALDKEGFPFCEKCKKRVPKVQIDHVTPFGDLLNGGIERLFCPSSKLKALCKDCHKKKTKQDNSVRLKRTKKIPDFF